MALYSGRILATQSDPAKSMPRNAKPAAMHLYEGNPSHLTPNELRRRAQAEIKVGTSKFKVPQRVKRIPAALAEWKRITKLYKDAAAEWVSTADAGIMERYCLLVADLEDLRDERETTPAKVTSTEVMYLDDRIRHTNELILRLDKELMLTPVARVARLVKKSAPTKADPLAAGMFGEVGSA